MEGWNPKVIVVGVDGSDPSIEAARAAGALAHCQSAKLIVVTVVRPPEGWWGIVGSPPTAEALGDSLSDAQRDVLDRTLRSVDLSGVDYETQEEIGEPSAQLIDVCKRVDADILVVGRRGAGLLRRMVVGSVANHVVHEAPCPVLVVP
ncbi:MAG: universal stress protein [Actinomycetota bacterium]|nr:universal stress protein [Actinomycetota bacterium]